jgi:HAD superfamily hydrolase (TIGR01490 family)
LSIVLKIIVLELLNWEINDIIFIANNMAGDLFGVKLIIRRSDMTVAAFFDIDGTLYREGLITELFKKLIKYEIIEMDKWYSEVRPEYENWDKRQGNYDSYLLKMVEIFIQSVKGLHRIQLEFIAKNIISQKGDRVYTFTRDKILWHKEQGHKVITVSGSPMELIVEMAAKYGFDDYIGTIYKMDENETYTGEVIPMWDSESKKKAIEGFIKKYDIELDKSYAYGDSSGDIAMLEMVEYPTCVNPTKELVTIAKHHPFLSQNLQVVVERKDVIYRLKPENI